MNMKYSLELKNKSGRYIVLKGGYCTPDTGCPAWGTSDPKKIRFIGDSLGKIVFRSFEADVEIPCILGYTAWMHGIWNERPAPFGGDYTDSTLESELRNSLYVKGAYENSEQGMICIDMNGIDVLSSVEIYDNPDKEGHCVFTEAYRTDMLPDDDVFWKSHIIDPAFPYPESVRESLERINYALNTYESDYSEAPDRYVLPETDGWKMHFTGTKLAEIATGIVHKNMENLLERTDPDGFIHTSYKDAPSWRYDGFGPYVMKANSYYDSFYSRDASRAIMTLNAFGYTDIASKSCEFGDKWAMYYPENSLTLGGKIVPGHFSVIPNKPLIYSQILTKIGVPALCDDPDAQGAWPTRYVRSVFGDECENLGNQETDGHGLMMTAHYAVWCSKGKDPSYVTSNWRYISELANWIVWCFDNPELSFVKDDLLYGETEAAMNDYTLYSNMPCMQSMYGFAEMARSVGKISEASSWTSIADRLRSAILKGFSSPDGKCWNCKKHGFYHDPAITFMADIYGYDTADMPSDFLSRSLNSYEADISRTVKHGWYGASGIGYNHSMITQNALLLDRTADASRLVESLVKLSYAPRLPEPYLVPEGISVDASRGIIRRQGDLANLVQLAEAMKCMLIVAGISPHTGPALKIMPRLPSGWQLSLENFRVQNTDSYVNLIVRSPYDISVSLTGHCPSETIAVRFGPFPQDTRSARVSLNGKMSDIPTFISGDASWGWVETETLPELL